MDTSDDGYFHYNDKFPPICFKPPYWQESDYEQGMDGAILGYLQESYKDGLKDPNTILPSGLSAGEAAVLYIRDTDRRRNGCYSNPEIQLIIDQLKICIFKHMGINVNNNQYIFEKHVNNSLFFCKQYKKHLLPALKAYLKEMDSKSKGYTYKLKQIISEISESNVEENSE